jgi:hypothetical protein
MFRMSFRMSRQFVPCSHAKDEHQDQQALYPMSTSFPFVQILSLQVSELRAAQSGQAEQAADAMLSSFLIKTLFYCRSQSCETHNPVRQSRQLMLCCPHFLLKPSFIAGLRAASRTIRSGRAGS